jgi:hypothetical protein
MCVHLNDKHLTVSIGEADGLTIIRARRPITVGEGDALESGVTQAAATPHVLHGSRSRATGWQPSRGI